MKKRICPKCGKKYSEHAAISRIDNKTEICPTCGLTEAWYSYFYTGRRDNHDSRIQAK